MDENFYPTGWLFSAMYSGPLDKFDLPRFERLAQSTLKELDENNEQIVYVWASGESRYNVGTNRKSGRRVISIVLTAWPWRGPNASWVL